jgi:predicted methyltransferase MtxX (methanogen marker protein 4)
MQIKISRDDISAAIKSYINRRIEAICERQRVDSQIAIEVDQTVIEVRSVDFEDRIRKLEEKVFGGG